MKPVIGVMPLWDDDKDSIWMLPGYLDGIREAGGLPVIFPLSADGQELNQLMDMCDGFLLTGGQDVSPEIYHEVPLEGKVDCCIERDRMERIILQKAIEEDKPVLGICRGIQFINAALGGTLYQDIPEQHPSEIEHYQHILYHLPVHDVIIEKNTPLYECLGVERLPVNSYHHQAVKDLAEGLMVMAVSTDGLVEAVCRTDCRFFWAVQWHPEFSYKTDENSRRIFRAFVGAMT